MVRLAYLSQPLLSVLWYGFQSTPGHHFHCIMKSERGIGKMEDEYELEGCSQKHDCYHTGNHSGWCICSAGHTEPCKCGLCGEKMRPHKFKHRISKISGIIFAMLSS